MIEKYWQHYKWRKNNHYYNIYLQHNLLGIWSVINVWGHNYSQAGKYQITFFDRYRDATAYVASLNKKRQNNHFLNFN